METWILEISAIIASIVALLLILILLSVFDGKPTFTSHHVTLNTIIAVCATAIRGGLLFAVSSALGQWKWEWYTPAPRPTMDFDTIDAASRGPVGSTNLLWRSRGM